MPDSHFALCEIISHEGLSLSRTASRVEDAINQLLDAQACNFPGGFQVASLVVDRGAVSTLVVVVARGEIPESGGVTCIREPDTSPSLPARKASGLPVGVVGFDGAESLALSQAGILLHDARN